MANEPEKRIRGGKSGFQKTDNGEQTYDVKGPGSGEPRKAWPRRLESGSEQGKEAGIGVERGNRERYANETK